MSYCRRSIHSDVYVYEAASGIICCRCRMVGKDVVMSGPLTMLTHLQKHINRGEKVPRAVLGRLLREANLQAALRELDALPALWRDRENNTCADELDAVLMELHKALDEWVDAQ